MRSFAAADDWMDAHTFPATAEEIGAEHGDVELELPNGTETLGDVMDRLGETTFENAEDARLGIYSAVSKGAIGRQNYSDRDAPPIGEDGPDPVSF